MKCICIHTQNVGQTKQFFNWKKKKISLFQSLVFAMLATFMILESNRSSRKTALIESNRMNEMEELERRKSELTRQLARQAVQVRELSEKVGNYSVYNRSRFN